MLTCSKITVMVFKDIICKTNHKDHITTTKNFPLERSCRSYLTMQQPNKHNPPEHKMLFRYLFTYLQFTDWTTTMTTLKPNIVYFFQFMNQSTPRDIQKNVTHQIYFIKSTSGTFFNDIWWWHKGQHKINSHCANVNVMKLINLFFCRPQWWETPYVCVSSSVCKISYIIYSIQIYSKSR